MNEGLIPSRYAKALHLYAEEAGKAAAVYEQTERLAAGYEAHPQMSRAVENPFLPLADKQQLLLVASGAMSTRFHRLRLPQRRASARLSWTKSRTPCKLI